MTLARSSHLAMSPTYIQPHNFADYLSNQQDYYLFLDIDGTLADFTLDPKDSFIPHTTLMLLQKIQSYGIKIAAVTGRSLIEARQMLSPLTLPIAATHGLEIAFDGVNTFNGVSNSDDISITHVDTTELTDIRQSIVQSSLPYSDFTIEAKPYSVALHYRQNPALADVACTIMSDILRNHANWTLKHGKCVCEAVPEGANKGTAILTLLKRIKTSDNVCAIFIGDDITDEAGFLALQGQDTVIKKEQKSAHNIGIKVGTEPTCAPYYVNDIYEVTELLKSFLTFCQKRNAPASNLTDAALPTTKKTMGYVI